MRVFKLKKPKAKKNQYETPCTIHNKNEGKYWM